MAAWGIDDHRIDTALAGVRAEPVSEPERDELFARAVWSVLIEPGDRVAGLLITAVGAERAARMMIDRAPASALVEACEGEISHEKATDARDRWQPRLRSDDVLRSLESAARCGARLVVPHDQHWPEGLAALGPSEPVLLWARGDTALLRRPGVAIVGARAATGYGEHVAMEFTAGLVARGVAIISGGAYGIDGMAHRAALASAGDTIAVLAGGVDRLYPSGHDALLTRVISDGLVIGEAPCGSAPTKWRFLQRKRKHMRLPMGPAASFWPSPECSKSNVRVVEARKARRWFLVRRSGPRQCTEARSVAVAAACPPASHLS